MKSRRIVSTLPSFAAAAALGIVPGHGAGHDEVGAEVCKRIPSDTFDRFVGEGAALSTGEAAALALDLANDLAEAS